MLLTTILTFAAVELALCLVPGPAVLSVVASSLRGGTRGGISAAIGVDIANVIYFIVSAIGVLSALLASHGVFIALKWAGTAYLMYLGIRAMLSKPHKGAAEIEYSSAKRSPIRATWIGLSTQLANPKAMVFFAAILPQFIDPAGRIVFQIVVLGCVSLIIETCVLTMYAIGADAARRTVGGSRSALWFERIGGALMVGVAARVAAT